MTEQKPKMTPERKKMLAVIVDTGLKSIAPQLVKMAAKDFEFTLHEYSSYLDSGDSVEKNKARETLEKSAEFYVGCVARYSKYLSQNEDYTRIKDLAEVTLKELNKNHPSAMWDVQPGA